MTNLDDLIRVRFPEKRRRKPGTSGKSLETTVLYSAAPLLCLTHTAARAKWVKGKVIQLRGDVDFVGAVCGTGRAICFDAKTCALERHFPVGNRDHLPDHQRDFLIRWGEARAVSGLVIESTANRRFYWLDWPGILHARGLAWPSVPWDWVGMVDLGPSTGLIDFRRVPGVVARKEANSGNA